MCIRTYRDPRRTRRRRASGERGQTSEAQPLELGIYAAFRSREAGGNVAAVVTAGDAIPPDRMRLIASDLSLPTIAFAVPAGDGLIDVRFYTSAGPIGACGHASAAVAADRYRASEGTRPHLLVRYPGGQASMQVHGAVADPTVEMQLPIAGWSRESLDPAVADAMGVPVDTTLPSARVTTGLTHLLVPVTSRAHLGAVRLDHDRWRTIGRRLGADTIGLFAIDAPGEIHLRDVCAPIGDTEEAASGTTASAITWHLHRLGLGDAFDVHQGVDMGRPSLLRTEVGDDAVQVSGRVARIAAGTLDPLSPPSEFPAEEGP